MGARITTFFQIRPGEARSVLLLVALLLLPAAGNSIGVAAAEALFYARVGVEYLPLAYIALGGVTSLATFGVTGLLGRVSRRRLYLTLPPFLAVLLALGRVLVGMDLAWSYPVLWLSTGLISTLQYMVAWGLAGLVFDTRQAKRLFPLFGAGSILGGALGGLLTRPLVQMFSTENLLLAWALTLLAALGLVSALLRDVDMTQVAPRRRRSRLVDELLTGLRFARRSQLWRWIAWAALLFALLFFMLTFPFSKAAAAEFPDEDALASFLGLFQGLTTGTALLVSLFLTRRVYARIGFTGALLAMPLIYLAAFAVLAAYAAFPALVLFRFLQLVWIYGVTSSAYQGTLNVVPPTHRDQVRAFIDGVPYQAGIVLSGLLLLAGERFFVPRQLFILGVVAAALATFTMEKARRAYGGALVAALRAGRPSVFYGEEQTIGGLSQDPDAITVAVAGVSDPDPRLRRVAAEILGNLRAPEATWAVVNGLADPDPPVRAALLRSLVRANAASALLEVAACLEDPEPEVRLQSVVTLRALAGYPRGLTAQVEPLLHDPDPGVRAAVASTLLMSDTHSEALEMLERMMHSDDVTARVEALEAFADWGDARAFDYAAPALIDPHPRVRRAALGALARIDVQRCFDPLIEALGDEDRLVRQAAADALGALGAPALEPTLGALADPALETGALLALAQLPAHRSADALRSHAQDRVVQALRYQDLGWSIKTAFPKSDRVDLLVDSLAATALRHGVNALRAISLLDDRDAIALAIENLASPNGDQRANALEMLDSIRERELIRPVLGLWEKTANGKPGPHGDDSDDATLLDSLQPVLKEKDAWLRACATLAAGAVLENVCGGDSSTSAPAAGSVPGPIQSEAAQMLRTALTRLAEGDPDPIVRETAAVSLDGGVAVETIPTLSLMERILFLRRVPLFADLPPAELKQVAGITGELLFADGEAIAQEGELGDEMYIIISGEVRVVADASEGVERELARRQSGDYVGEMAIISHEPRMASLVADGDVRLLYIDQGRFEGILRERPETSLAVMRQLCVRLRERQVSAPT
jgi:HEAT repeat protein